MEKDYICIVRTIGDHVIGSVFFWAVNTVTHIYKKKRLQICVMPFEM